MAKKHEPLVYVVQETNTFSLAKATRFGFLTPVLPANRQITMNPQPVIRELKRALRNYCDSDFLLLIGDPAAIALAVFVAGEMNRGRVQLLKWDRELNDYYMLRVDLYDRPVKMEDA